MNECNENMIPNIINQKERNTSNKETLKLSPPSNMIMIESIEEPKLPIDLYYIEKNNLTPIYDPHFAFYQKFGENFDSKECFNGHDYRKSSVNSCLSSLSFNDFMY